MLAFQWNALRVGDRVAVHDDSDADLEPHEAIVALLQTRQFGANEIGLRRTDQPTTMLRPRRHAVHLLPFDQGIPCWRCNARAHQRATP